MKPDLLIQLQRLGDLVLSFPLLKCLEGEMPIRVVAEPAFYEALLPIAPPVLFMPHDAQYELLEREYTRVINLSHRPESARLAGALRADSHYGLCLKEGNSRIFGNWQLYRVSLVHNNRHNLLHWADLNGLDLLDPVLLTRAKWPLPDKTRNNGRVGLFVGASEAAKRPDPEFWGQLALDLSKRGFKPVFMGGAGETDLAARAAAIAGLPGSNLSNHFSLSELVYFMGQLDLLITPDTGPMHVASWTGTPCLNLSMGPVNAWETAPSPPGHFVLRSSLSCSGCWRCVQERILCKQSFVPSRVGSLTAALLKGNLTRLPRLPGLELSLTGRNRQGLFELFPLSPVGHRARFYLSDVWRQWFLHCLGGPRDDLETALSALALDNLSAVKSLGSKLRQYRDSLVLYFGKPLAEDYWRSFPALIRPWTNFVQLKLENEDYSSAAKTWILEKTAELIVVISI